MTGGRPSKYKEEYNEEVMKYLAIRTDVFDETTRKLKVKLPTLEGFAIHIEVNKTTLYEWDKKYPEFSNSLDKIRTEQQNRLLDMGLSGDYNSTIAKLVLSSNHGMREKSDVTTDGKELPTPILNNVPRNDSNKESDVAQEKD